MRKTERERKEDLATEISQKTRKKIKVVGTAKYINAETGELEEMQVISIEQRDANFYKIWLSRLLETLDLIGCSKTKFVFWLIDNINSDNQIIMTYKQMSEKSGFNYKTIQRVMKVLIESDFIIKINQGAYRINPNIIFKGSIEKRMNILFQYNTEKLEQEKKDTERKAHQSK